MIIVQARMGSKRLPGKTLMPVGGKPMLTHLLESLMQGFKREEICVASSRAPENEPVERLCRELGVQIYRGDETNVASRFLEILSRAKPHSFVRLSADSPLLDHRVVLKALSMLKGEVDIVTTVSASPYPSGMNVEALRTSVFLENYPNFGTSDHFEHVTKYFYESREKFKIEPLEWRHADSKRYKFSLDTQEDHTRLDRVFKALNRPHYELTLEEKCSVYDRLAGQA